MSIVEWYFTIENLCVSHHLVMNFQFFAGGTHRLVRLEAAHRALPSAVDPNGAPWAPGVMAELQGAFPSLNSFSLKS